MTELTNKIQDYINSNNEFLWKEVSKKHNIRLILNQSEYSWLVTKSEKGYNIICPNTEVSSSSFTHELLHIYIEDLGMPSYEYFYNSYKHDNIFNPLFNNLFGYIFNFSCHKKMFPFYNQMGFSEYEFVQKRIDYNWRRHFKIKVFFKIKKLKIIGIDQFLGNYFALKNNVVAEDLDKCQKYLNKLKILNPELYQIAERFDNNWNKSEDYNFLKHFNQFKTELKDWLIKIYHR